MFKKNKKDSLFFKIKNQRLLTASITMESVTLLILVGTISTISKSSMSNNFWLFLVLASIINAIILIVNVVYFYLQNRKVKQEWKLKNRELK